MRGGEAMTAKTGIPVPKDGTRSEPRSGGSVPRILFAAPASGSGKTVLTCGFLKVLQRRGLAPVSFKCGPDYIDPLFHRHVLKVPGCNLDSFFQSEAQVRAQLARAASGRDTAVIEGVMGFYDGLGGVSTAASTYDIARITDTPVILILDGKKSSLSLAAQVKGFLEYQADSRIRGVILNRTSAAMAERLRPHLEVPGVRLFGAVPECEAARLESRHLGLVLPQEQEELDAKLNRLAAVMEENLDIDGLLALAAEAGALSGTPSTDDQECISTAGAERGMPVAGTAAHGSGSDPSATAVRRIAVARDEAFCFYYQDNLDFLQEHGWQPVFFSPLHDEALPPEADALLLGGGYPERYAKELAANRSMCEAVHRAATGGHVRVLAECGGFLYLHRQLEGMDGQCYPMAGVLAADAFRAEKRTRFGYISLTGTAGEIRGHEFHYWESSDPGAQMRAQKPCSTRSWDCMHVSETMLAGFPHLYYRSGAGMILRFLDGKGGSR